MAIDIMNITQDIAVHNISIEEETTPDMATAIQKAIEIITAEEDSMIIDQDIIIGIITRTRHKIDADTITVDLKDMILGLVDDMKAIHTMSEKSIINTTKIEKIQDSLIITNKASRLMNLKDATKFTKL